MPVKVDDDARLDENEARALKKRIGDRLGQLQQYWWPLHARQDYWASMYFMLDVIQQMKPLGFRRFISNEPRTAVDSAASILTRNDPYWRIDLHQFEMEDNDARRVIGKIEQTLQGVVFDADELFTLSGRLPVWKQVSYQALLRGWLWGKFHVTSQALDYRESPLIPEIWDARTVYPQFDQFGLREVVKKTYTTVGDVLGLYPEAFPKWEGKQDVDPAKPAVKLEYWSSPRPGQEGVTGTLGVLDVRETTPSVLAAPIIPTDNVASEGEWIIPPYKHGYQADGMPVVYAPVNGVPLEQKPAISTGVAQVYEMQSNVFGIHSRLWQGPNTIIAESGRSILAAIEEQMPQFNELIATLFQYLSINTFPTLVFRTATGELPPFEEGINARIPLRPEESVDRLEPTPVNPDAFRLLELLREEQQKGTLSDILRATLPSGLSGDASGIFFQQITNSALNALEPFHDGIQHFGSRMGTSILRQMQAGAKDLKKFVVSVPDRQHTYFSIEFDPRTDLDRRRKYHARPVFKPALPDDIHIRLQTARLALDPRRPIMSLVTILERIIQVEDPMGEMDRIWEDMANNDPVIVLEQIALALERQNEPELAARIREQEFRTKFLQDLAFRQQTGSLPGQGGQGGGENPGPETGAPESTQRTGTPSERDLAALRAEGATLVGSAGETGAP